MMNRGDDDVGRRQPRAVCAGSGLQGGHVIAVFETKNMFKVGTGQGSEGPGPVVEFIFGVQLLLTSSSSFFLSTPPALINNFGNLTFERFTAVFRL